MRIRLLLLLALGTAACAFPARDNRDDPAHRPQPRIDVTVDGVASATGGRHSVWSLSGAGSQDGAGKPITEALWELSSADAPDAESASYLVLGSAGVASASQVVLVNGSAGAISLAFRTALAGISDFVPDAAEAPGTGRARRWVRLTLHDSAGNVGRTTTSINIVNHAPMISLGPDRRIAPGGQWWTAKSDTNGDGVTDIFDAVPRTVRLVLAVTDADPGDAASSESLAIPAIWKPSGAVATALDLDGDGFVDDAFFADSSHRILQYPASLSPSRSAFDVTLGDVLVGGAPAAVASAHVRADVASSVWIFDAALDELSRVGGRFEGADIPRLRAVLAANSAHVLVADQDAGTASSSDLVSYELGFQTVGAPVVIANVSPAALHATGDGATGWWVADATHGTLTHRTAALVVDRNYAQLEAAGDLLLFTNLRATVVRASGSTDVWALARPVSANNGGGKRLLRLSKGGLPAVVAVDAFDGTATGEALCSDGAGGVWVAGKVAGALVARHVLADGSDAGTRMINAAGGSVITLSYDAAHGRLWGGFDTLVSSQGFVSDADGVRFGVANALQVEADPTDGSAIFLVNQQNKFIRVAASLEVQAVLPFDTGDMVGGSVATPEGTLIATAFNGGNNRLAVFEGAEPAIPLIVPVPVQPQFGRGPFVADPTTGFVWIWRSVEGLLEERAADGSIVRSVDLSAEALGATASLSFDEARQILWFGYSSPGSTAGLIAVPVPSDLTAAITPIDVSTPYVLKSLGSVSAVPGGQVCVVAGDGALSNSKDAFAFRPSMGDVSNGAAINTQDLVGQSDMTASGQAADGSCWFLPDSVASESAWRIGSAAGAPDAALMNGMRYMPDSVADFWLNATWAPTLNQKDNWLSEYLPGVGPTLTAPTLRNYAFATACGAGQAPAEFTCGASSISYDPFYRHLFVGFGTIFNVTAEGVVVRIPVATRVEAARYSGFVTPSVRSGQ